MKKLNNSSTINFDKSGYEVVQRQNLPFKVKGTKADVVLFKRQETNDFFVFESGQTKAHAKDFLSFCFAAIHPFFHKSNTAMTFLSKPKNFMMTWNLIDILTTAC